MPFETWEVDHKVSKSTLAIALIIVLVGSAATAYAIYKITSPTVETNAVEPAQLSIVINGTAYFDPGVHSYPDVNVGDTLIFKSQLDDGAAEETVTFYVNDQPIGFDSTDNTGTATYEYTVTEVGALTFYTECVHS